MYLVGLVAVLIHINNACHCQSCKCSCLQHTFASAHVPTVGQHHMTHAITLYTRNDPGSQCSICCLRWARVGVSPCWLLAAKQRIVLSQPQ